MEQPDYSKLERRIAELEDNSDIIITIAKEGLRLSKLHALNLQQVLAIIGRNELNLGTALERLDHIEQNMATVATKDDVTAIKETLAGQSERFDGSDRSMDSLDSKMDQIIALLQKGTP